MRPGMKFLPHSTPHCIQGAREDGEKLSEAPALLVAEAPKPPEEAETALWADAKWPDAEQ